MPRRKIIIRKTPFEFVERFDDDGNEESWGLTREENDENLAWESADLRKTRFNGRKPKPEELEKADEIDAWRVLKAGDDATSAIETTMQRFQKLFDEAFFDDPLLDWKDDGYGGYACDQSGAYLVDQAREKLLDLLGDMDAVRPDRFNEDLRNKLIAEARALFKKIKGVYFKDYLTWFESVISKISVQDSRLVFTEDPAPIVVGKNLNTLILFA